VLLAFSPFSYTTLFRSGQQGALFVLAALALELALGAILVALVAADDAGRRLLLLVLALLVLVLDDGGGRGDRALEERLDVERPRSEEHTSELQSRGHLV